MPLEYLRRCLLLQALPGLGSRALGRLLQHCGGVDALWNCAPEQWPPMPLAPGVTAAFRRMRERDRCNAAVDIEAQLALLQGCAARVLCISDRDYPPLLRAIDDPPALLYLRGDADLLSRPQLAVVGARRASSGGLRAARELSAAAAAAGLVITSGLARGIDGAAHSGALEAGPSVAVMATGIEQVYPRGHRKLAEALCERGCLVSELPPGCGPRREHFPRRNRLISGLSLGVLVVEAALPSGSLITAGTALQQHREVFTLPWSIYHPGGRGCLQLLRDGAALVQGVEDLFAELESLVALQRELSLPLTATAPAPEPERDLLLTLIGDGCVTVDELARDCTWPLAQTLATLSQLELEGAVVRTPGGYCRP